MNILIVDDDERVCEELKAFFESQNQQTSYALSVKGALVKIRLQHFDCIILDVDFGHDKPDGGSFVQQMNEIFIRVPVVIHTGNPESAERFKEKVFDVFKRGCDLTKVLERLLEIQNTGIAEIIGAKGSFESEIQKYYHSFFMANKDVWIDRAKRKPEQVKSSLFRSLVYRIEQSCEGDSYVEEFYLPPPDEKLYSGLIVKKGDEYYMIISPACDIEYRAVMDDKNQQKKDASGNVIKKPKVSQISLCKIEKHERFGISLSGNGNKVSGSVKQLTQNSNDHKELLRYHLIPPVGDFAGGFLNFSTVESCAFDSFKSVYTICDKIVSPPFLKNIMSRFSSYFARQGQPDLDLADYTTNLTWIQGFTKLNMP